MQDCAGEAVQVQPCNWTEVSAFCSFAALTAQPVDFGALSWAYIIRDFTLHRVSKSLFISDKRELIV